MNIQPLDIVLHMINIVVLYVLLRALLYNPVRKFMQARTDSMQSRLDEASRMQEEGKRLQEEYQNQFALAEAKAAELLEERTRQAEETAARITRNAQEQAEEQLRQMGEHIRQQQRDALVSQEAQIANMALALTRELLQREVNPEDQQAAIDAFFSKVS